MSATPDFIERLEPASPSWKRYGLQHLQRYAFALPMLRGMRVLDLACGTGYGAYVLASNGAAEVVAVDNDEHAVAQAKQRFQADNLIFIKADGQFFEQSTPFDAVVSFETIEHVPDPNVIVKTFAKNLAAGGLLILSAPNKAKHSGGVNPWENPFHLHEPTYQELLDWLSAEFLILERWEQSPVNADVAFNADQMATWQSSYILNGLVMMESKIRKWLHKPWPRREAGSRMDRWSEIVPLLPDRCENADVFLLVCQKRSKIQ